MYFRMKQDGGIVFETEGEELDLSLYMIDTIIEINESEEELATLYAFRENVAGKAH